MRKTYKNNTKTYSIERLRWECIKKLKILKYHLFVIKHYFFLIFVISVEVKMLKIDFFPEANAITDSFKIHLS